MSSIGRMGFGWLYLNTLEFLQLLEIVLDQMQSFGHLVGTLQRHQRLRALSP